MWAYLYVQKYCSYSVMEIKCKYVIVPMQFPLIP